MKHLKYYSINESPVSVYVQKYNYTANYENDLAQPFAFHPDEKQIWVGNYKESHMKNCPFIATYYEDNKIWYDDLEYKGRLWYETEDGEELKIISFWDYPEDAKEMKYVIERLEKELGEDFSDWQIDLESGLIPVSEYIGSRLSEKDKKIYALQQKLHIASASEKEKIYNKLKSLGVSHYTKGFGSDYYTGKLSKGVTPAQHKNKITKYRFTESFKLFESPDSPFQNYKGKSLLDDELDWHGLWGTEMNYRSKDGITFGYVRLNDITPYKNVKATTYTIDNLETKLKTTKDKDLKAHVIEMIPEFKYKLETNEKELKTILDMFHVNSIDDLKKLPTFTNDGDEFHMLCVEKGSKQGHNDFGVARLQQKLNGRIWYERKYISFWFEPKNYKELIKIIKDIDKSYEILYGEKLNIYENRFDWIIESGKNYMALTDFKKGEERSEEELNTPHVISPMKKDTKTPKGFGSRKSKKWKEWQKPFECIKYEDYCLINEVGDASVPAYEIDNKISMPSFFDAMSDNYYFNTETLRYVITILSNMSEKHLSEDKIENCELIDEDPQDFYDKLIAISFFPFEGDDETFFNNYAEDGKKITNRGEMFGIMSTLKEVILNYIKENPKVKYIFFGGERSEKGIDKEQRDRLYMAYFKKLKPKWESDVIYCGFMGDSYNIIKIKD